MDPILTISLIVLSTLASVLLLAFFIFLIFLVIRTWTENEYKRGVRDGLDLAGTVDPRETPKPEILTETGDRRST
jgi:hypothetical protein